MAVMREPRSEFAACLRAWQSKSSLSCRWELTVPNLNKMRGLEAIGARRSQQPAKLPEQRKVWSTS